jgi:gliding motility-associated-like protein
MKTLYLYIGCTLFLYVNAFSQNGIVGDGFGGRLWYKPTNYSVGSYTAYSLCIDFCDQSVNQLYGWGNNGYNQLGYGNIFIGSAVPVPIPNMNNVKYYTTGYLMGAIKNDNTGWAWGIPSASDPSVGINSAPIQVISNVKFVDASISTVSFVKNDGSVWSIGKNTAGNFGNGVDNNFTSVPSQMLNITNAVRVSNNSLSTSVLLSDSTIMTVGYGFLGQGANVTTIIPLPILNMPKIVDIKSHSYGTIALTEDGDVYYYGYFEFDDSDANLPVKLTSLKNIVAISGCDDGRHFLALDEDKNCYAWGNNEYGQCGNNLSTYHDCTDSIPIVAQNVIDIMAGETFSYIVKSDGSLWGTGESCCTSIWMNLQDEKRYVFTQIDPSLVPNSCPVNGLFPTVIDCNENTLGSIDLHNYSGEQPLSYSIGGDFQFSSFFSNLGAGNYTATVMDANGCNQSIEIELLGENCPEVPVIIEQPVINIPNVFSPDDDNINDLFYFESKEIIELECQILNRWGNLIYTMNGINSSWDGKNESNQDCNEGVYFYVLKYLQNDKTWKNKTGYLTLVRKN